MAVGSSIHVKSESNEQNLLRAAARKDSWSLPFLMKTIQNRNSDELMYADTPFIQEIILFLRNNNIVRREVREEGNKGDNEMLETLGRTYPNDLVINS